MEAAAAEAHVSRTLTGIVRRTGTLSRDVMDLYVLDSLANDIESFDDVIRLVNHPEIGWADEFGRRILAADVLPSLHRLVRDGFVELLSEVDGHLTPLPPRSLPVAPLESFWFALTPRGRILHTNWDE
jgi:hypothetical protein